MQEAAYAFGSTYERELQLDDATWRRRVTDRVRFVAEVDGVVAGTASGGDADVHGSAALTAMWVDPRFRRAGVAGLLVETVLDWGRTEGYDRVLLWVTEMNHSAERLYTRNGFQRTGATQDVRPGELEFEMSRSLR